MLSVTSYTVQRVDSDALPNREVHNVVLASMRTVGKRSHGHLAKPVVVKILR
jgi:hypothetical protein